MVCILYDVGTSFDSLWVDGSRGIRARFPNGDPEIPRDGFSLTGTALGPPYTGDGTPKPQNNPNYPCIFDIEMSIYIYIYDNNL